MKKNIYIYVVLTLLFLFPALLQGEQQLPLITSISDGPYVFWQNQTADIFYVIKGKLIHRSINAEGKTSISVHIPELGQSLKLSPKAPEPEPSVYLEPDKVFAVSDIHGQFNSFFRMLRVHKVIDKKSRWSYGTGHLVVNGDVFDRGPDVTQSLWLIHQLSRQAKKAGGRVHMLLGNHEVMVLQGDLRYLHPKYQLLTAEVFKEPMNHLYGKTSELGRWLRTRNTVIKIGNVLFVHAGIHPYFIAKKYTIDSLNQAVRRDLDTPRETIRSDQILSFLFRGRGPLWYRGFFMDTNGTKRLNDQHIKLFQSYFGIHCIVVGHTTRKHVHHLYGKHVIAIDSGFKYGDRGEGLLLDMKKKKAYRVTLDGRRYLLKKIKQQELDLLADD